MSSREPWLLLKEDISCNWSKTAFKSVCYENSSLCHVSVTYRYNIISEHISYSEQTTNWFFSVGYKFIFIRQRLLFLSDVKSYVRSIYGLVSWISGSWQPRAVVTLQYHFGIFQDYTPLQNLITREKQLLAFPCHGEYFIYRPLQQ